MNTNQVKETLIRQGIDASPAHIEATSVAVSALVKGTAERFAGLPLEAEPSGFQAELRASAP